MTVMRWKHYRNVLVEIDVHPCYNKTKVNMNSGVLLSAKFDNDITRDEYESLVRIADRLLKGNEMPEDETQMMFKWRHSE